ncbi:hypothetical protein [Chitinophaga caseinilytica]|uniref:hypothetical protein n=1 Tax=Chitinophaga caseinilytica TaxID=2267521 RepID=UPI003C2CDF8F
MFVDIPTTGKSLAAEDVFGTVEAVKTVSTCFSACCRYDRIGERGAGMQPRTGEYRPLW